MRITAIFCLLAACLVLESEAVCQYTVIAPKGLRVNTPGTIYIDFHGGCGPVVTIASTLMSQPEGDSRHDSENINERRHGNKPVKITLQPKIDSLERRANGNVEKLALVDIKFCFPPNCAAWTSVPGIKILLNTTYGYIFMTTNRPAYRPLETVEFSLALTKQDLKLGAERRPVKILIKTPEDQGRVTVHDSEPRVMDAAGFIAYTYRIPENPFQGVWWAEAHIDDVKMAEKSFVIEKYELPTFQVKIHPRRHFILPTQTHLQGEITAVYSYGESVSGSYFMSFKLVRDDGSEQEFHKIPSSFDRRARITRGRKTYEIPITALENILRAGETLDGFVDTNAKVVITASVTGHTESVFESDAVDNIEFTRSPFIIDYSRSAKFFLPRTIYELKITVLDVVSHTPLPGVFVKLEWSGRHKKMRSDKNGEIYHEIDTFEKIEETVTVTTDSEEYGELDQFRVDFKVRKFTPTRQLGMRLKKQVADVGDVQHITFSLGASSPPDIRFFVISRGQFIHAETKISAGQNGDVTTDFPVTAEMVPNARVVAYYILGGEMTSNSAWFDVTNVCKNELEIRPGQEEVTPGAPVHFIVEGAPHSVFYFTAVDRAAYFVHNGTRLSRDKLWSKMEQYDTGCSRKGGLDAINVFEEAGLTINSPLTPKRRYRNMYCVHSRKKRSVVLSPDAAIENRLTTCATDGRRFNAAGLTCHQRENLIRRVMENNKEDESFIVNCINRFHKACSSGGSGSTLARAAMAAGDKANQVRTQVRRDFAENWFFSRRTIGANGLVKISQKAKDSITIWDLDAFGMSEESPMCVAKSKELKVFTDFFIQLYLPYSVRVREQVTIRFSVFNYGEEPGVVPVYIKHSDELCSRFQSDEFQLLETIVVEANSATASTFTVLPLKIPEGKRARIEIKVGNRDHIEKTLLIEGPGLHNESSKTIVLQPNENGEPNTQDLMFDIPKRSVMLNTRKCHIFAYAHPMGPSIEIDPFEGQLKNMDKYIHQPAGCGEQNMIRVGPIVYIHRYRVEVYEDRVTIAQKRQVVAHIQSAYTIELRWRSDKVQKKAFAVWNTHPPSTWLNAFVTKVFSAAQEFWPGMDTGPLCTALKWLLGQQNADGSFKENSVVHHEEMRGQVDEMVSLTAYVSISLIESESICPDMSGRLQAAANKANRYLKTRTNDVIQRPYTLAMGAYALAVSEPGSLEAANWNRMLRDTKEHDGEYIFWRGTRGRAANIETTAYALLAELRLNGINVENDDRTRNTAHWLISQRNDKGGFVSTQDTVVALQALSAYMGILEISQVHAPPPTNLRVRVTAKDPECKWHNKPQEMNLTPEDSMKRRELEVLPLAVVGGVSVSVVGVGTGSLAYRCTWRQHNDDGNCAFHVEVSVHDDNAPNIKILKVVVRKVHGPPAQISIIDVGILSGFEPDEDSVKELCDVVDRSADRYEITENTVKFYLSGVDSDGVKLAFRIKETSVVKNRQPSSVSAYDYYEPDIRCTKFYTQSGDHQIRSTCAGGDRGDDEAMCKCAEGDCPICRTREQQLEDTVCSTHRDHRRLCAGMCKAGRESCYNLHTETCRRDYVYVVRVTEVGDDEIPGFKYFLAHVNEVYRTSEKHREAAGTVVKFLIRDDCFEKCRDKRFARIARDKTTKTGIHHDPQHYITVDRILLIYGVHPSKDDSTDPPNFVYDLTVNGGMEAVMDTNKCAQLLGSENVKKTNICQLKGVLKQAHLYGCD